MPKDRARASHGDSVDYWLRLSAAVSCVAIALQLPYGQAIVAMLDVRHWTWRVYAAIFAACIVVLWGLKSWTENAWDRR
jgi:hypothetical protein